MMAPASRAATLPRLIAITDAARFTELELLRGADALGAAAAPGQVAIMLRDHQATTRRRLALGRQLRASTLANGQQLWVADRLDLTLALEADAAHLGEGSVPPAEARRLLGPARTISRAWHHLSAGDLTELELVDAVLLSPVHDARKRRPPLGLSGLTAFGAALGATSRAKLFALGGVNAANARASLAAGAWGVAAISAAFDEDPTPLLEALAICR